MLATNLYRLNLPFKTSLIACAIVATSVATADTNYGIITKDHFPTGDVPKISINTPSIADGIDVHDLKTMVTQHNFTINVTNRFEVNGDTYLSTYSDKVDEGAWDKGSYTFYLEGDAAEAYLNGNVEIINRHAKGLSSDFGANALYAQKGASITIGTAGTDTLTRIISIASTPDAISEN